jgi:hypothetical protein
MLSKCANPTCSNPFRYLHEGKLYLISSISRFDGRKQLSKPASNSSPLEYAWLCSVCSSYMTIIIDEENGTIVVCTNETLKCEEPRSDLSIFQ